MKPWGKAVVELGERPGLRGDSKPSLGLRSKPSNGSRIKHKKINRVVGFHNNPETTGCVARNWP